MDRRLRLTFSASDPLASHQTIQIVTIRPIRAEPLFIKQAFDAAAQANLIGAVMETHRPAHPAMPAAAENHDASRTQSGSNHAKWP